jgi:hypothetical protein
MAAEHGDGALHHSVEQLAGALHDSRSSGLQVVRGHSVCFIFRSW